MWARLVLQLFAVGGRMPTEHGMHKHSADAVAERETGLWFPEIHESCDQFFFFSSVICIEQVSSADHHRPTAEQVCDLNWQQNKPAFISSEQVKFA